MHTSQARTAVETALEALRARDKADEAAQTRLVGETSSPGPHITGMGVGDAAALRHWRGHLRGQIQTLVSAEADLAERSPAAEFNPTRLSVTLESLRRSVATALGQMSMHLPKYADRAAEIVAERAGEPESARRTRVVAQRAEVSAALRAICDAAPKISILTGFLLELDAFQPDA